MRLEGLQCFMSTQKSFAMEDTVNNHTGLWLFPIGAKALSGSVSDGPISGIRFNYRTSLRGWSRAPCSSFVTLVSSIWAQKGQ